MNQSLPRIAILGSCVTRQAFVHRERSEDWQLPRPVLYTARTSLVTLQSPPLTPPRDLLAGIADPFELRCTRDDFRRSFWNRLRAAEPDLLILDLMDERFDLLAARQDGELPRYATLNEQIEAWDRAERLNARRLVGALKRRLSDGMEAGIARFGLRRLRRLTEVGELWHDAADGFVRRLRQEFPRLPVILHLAPLATAFEEGMEGARRGARLFWQRQPARVTALRGLLQGYGGRLRALLPEAAVIQLPPELHRLKRRHIWGEAPWHYANPYYQALVREIRTLAR